jgi:hypothetical protein
MQPRFSGNAMKSRKSWLSGIMAGFRKNNGSDSRKTFQIGALFPWIVSLTKLGEGAFDQSLFHKLSFDGYPGAGKLKERAGSRPGFYDTKSGDTSATA